MSIRTETLKRPNPLWLPDDIVRHIIEFLSGSPKDLERCTLPILFCPCHDRCLMASLFVYFNKPSFPSFISADPGLKNPQPCMQLSLTALNFDLSHSSGPLASSFLQQMPLRTFPLLKKLVLTKCFQLIPGELELEELSLSLDCYNERSLDIPEAPLPSFSAIRSLAYMMSTEPELHSPFLLEHLHPILLNLHRLVARTAKFHVPAILQLADANEATLKTLDIFEVFDLSDGTLLCMFILRDILFKLPVSPHQLADYLSALKTMFFDIDWNRSSVRFITFDISSPYLLVDMGQHSDLWARLVEALCGYSGLEMVTLVLETDPYDVEEECVTRRDVEVHPAFEPLRAAGRFVVRSRAVIVQRHLL
ncbi:hypothetical protein BT96DRAFT_914056 [Gymnopus androsaceus JB14]|uniref:Uncharacterized protein n=1 Tax=Gymnopus androsaceus JB14 TaxID=1447944 RepID=A0A6A4IGV6_9AGAR|nr:hypothetical protein BT96DRAFT_914056 [Gymnopus androsaceus JB14]